MTAHAYAFTLERKAPHLNFRWSIADMDRLELLALRRTPVSQIAAEFQVSENDIIATCQRNSIHLLTKPGAP